MTTVFEKYGDPRVAKWLFMVNPAETIELTFLYLMIVKFIGPMLMKNREPYNLKKCLIFYNFLQVSFSLWMTYEFAMSGWLTGEYNFRCQTIDYSNKPSTLRMLNISWWYFFSKFTEFFDTFFFVMRKKFDQVSTLHVIHHSIMPLSSWTIVKFYPGGYATFPGLINSLIHVIMYAYYMLSACGPNYRKYLWWKKYLTSLQLVQFVVVSVAFLQLLATDCGFPQFLIWFMLLHSFMFFLLFRTFYNKSYRIKRKAT